MAGVTNTSFESRATCDDLVTGSLTVFVNDGGVARVNEDSTFTGGGILGPGSPSLLCEDKVVSVKGDSIASHLPCPIPETHCAAFTGGSSDVFAGSPIQ